MEDIMIKNVVIGVKSQVIVREEGCKTKDWHNLKRRARRNNYSLPKQVLVDVIKGEIRENGTLHKIYDNVLVIELEPCISKAEYKTWDDIPNESVPCPCGNPTHWLIKYEDLRNKEKLDK